jgi:hypothetical protein
MATVTYGNAHGAAVNFFSHMLIYFMSIMHVTSRFQYDDDTRKHGFSNYSYRNLG